jgi:hypothetical protein
MLDDHIAERYLAVPGHGHHIAPLDAEHSRPMLAGRKIKSIVAVHALYRTFSGKWEGGSKQTRPEPIRSPDQHCTPAVRFALFPRD